jgi:hypothetical protein
MRRLLGLVVLALVAATLLGPGQAFADHVRCGDVITQDTTLDSDLIDCPRFGIVIGADNITLDLNRHTIDGLPGSYFTAEAGVVNGVYANDSPAHDGVVIKNGVVREFLHGVLLSHSRDPNNSASHNSVYDLTTVGNGNGIALGERADHNVVTGNQASGNEPANEGSGIRLESVGPGNLIRGNLLSENYWGIFYERGVGARIEHNRSSRNTEEGILLIEVEGAVIAKNLLAANSVGIGVRDSGSVRIEQNRVFHSSHDGIVAGGSFDHGGNHLIRHNVAENNQDDGIQISEQFALPSATLSGNRANENGDLGIEADEGVIDGGHNRAIGNGNPLQCLNVVCR